jgi:hypothetical protein
MNFWIGQSYLLGKLLEQFLIPGPNLEPLPHEFLDSSELFSW